MNVPFVDLNIQHEPLKSNIHAAIDEVIRRGDFCLGESLEVFEEKFARYCGTQYAVGVDSGHSALKLSLEALDIGPGDEVILPSHTFMATASAVSLLGAVPVLVEVDPVTYTIDPTAIRAAVTPHTRAIIPVHLYGYVADMDVINDIAAQYGLFVIEDACQAHGAMYRGMRAGSLGHAGAFSFYPTKNLGAMGDAGIIVTNDKRLAERARAMRNVGQYRKGYHAVTPYNHRMDTMQAAVLHVKLDQLDHNNDARQQAAQRYSDALSGTGLQLPYESPDAGTSHVYHLYVVRSKQRDQLRDYLADTGVHTAIHYPVPIHLQPFYMRQEYPEAMSLENTTTLCDEIVSLPMFPGITSEQIDYVAEQIHYFVTQMEPVR